MVIQESKKAVESEITLLASLQHELRGQILLPIQTEFNLIKDYLDRKEANTEPFKWTDAISERPKSRRIEEAFLGIDKIISTATVIFNNMQSIIDLDKGNLKREKVNLLSYLKSEVEKFDEMLSDSNVNTTFESRGKVEIECEIDPDKFSYVISNFIRNSIDHGFNEKQENKHLLFKIQKTEDKQNVILDLIDSGKGFPDDFSLQDYISYKIKSSSKGSGIGGYLVNKAIDIHDGKLDYIEDDKGRTYHLPTISPQNLHKSLEQNVKFKIGVHFKVILPILNQD